MFRYLVIAASLACASIVSAADEPKPRAVLVTGASTGIGRQVTEHLAAHGWYVYAGARKPEDLEALAKIQNVRAVKLDVTKQADIDAAVEIVTKTNLGLHALVNNAGIATVGTATETSPEEFDLVMQVNAYGPYRITRAFAPLIIASKGRITTISSISGILSVGSLTAYSMSKHAVEAYGDSLAAQMAPLGVHVSLIEPGNFDSDIGKSAAARTGADNRLSDRSRYKKPIEVALAVEQALTEENPRRRYMVTPNQDEAEVTIRKQIEQLTQLNEGHAYTYDRDALVKMLDESLAKSRPKAAKPAN